MFAFGVIFLRKLDFPNWKGIMMEYLFYIPTKIYHGAGKLNILHTLEMPGKKALIVTTKGKSVERLGYLGRLCEQLQMAKISYCCFREVSTNPTTEDVAKGVAVVKENGCDFIVGLGGGSALDAAKAIALVATNGGDIWDYEQMLSGAGKPVEQIPLPLIAIPTTAGTGSEADAGFVINNIVTKQKNGIGSPYSFPQISIVDPELMASVPPLFTAFQGFDVLFHAIECYLSKGATPISDALVLETVRRVATFLPRAVADGSDMEARDEMAIASTMAGMIISTSALSLAHAIEHSLSGVCPELTHGCGLLLIGSAYLRRCAGIPACSERMIRLADAMGRENPTEPVELVNAFETLEKKCGVANLKMSDYGIVPDDFPRIAEGSHGRGYYNDLGGATDEEVVKILNASYR